MQRAAGGLGSTSSSPSSYFTWCRRVAAQNPAIVPRNHSWSSCEAGGSAGGIERRRQVTVVITGPEERWASMLTQRGFAYIAD